MKKIILSLLLIAAACQTQAQVIYYGTPYWSRFSDSQETRQTGIVAGSVVGVAGIIGNTIIKAQQIKAQKEAMARYEKEKVEQKAKFPSAIQTADSLFSVGNYSLALQSYAACAHNNDNYEEDLGDQHHLITRIAECNEKLNVTSDQPCVLNNFKARSANYSAYTSDVENPVYKSKKKNNYATITRVCCNDKETRIEFEYNNTYNGEVALGIKGDTYIKGKKSGKLKMRKIENITISPAKTTIAYGHQTLKFALIFPALDPRDEYIDFREPSSEWQFNDIVCR